MALSSIKKEHADKYVAFGKNAKKLGERDDIDDLAIIGHQSGDESIIELFDTLPSLAELQKAKTDAQLPKQAPVAPKAPVAAPATTDNKAQ